MTELTRRGFLTGVATVAAGGLIVAASDKEVEAFAGIGNRVSVLTHERPFIASGQVLYGTLSRGQQLYDEHGKVVAVVQEVYAERKMVDATDGREEYQTFMPGLLRISATVVAV